MPKLVPETVTYKVLGLTEILTDEECDHLAGCSDFSWGDTDVTYVALASFFYVCEKREITLSDEVRALPPDTYIDLNK